MKNWRNWIAVLALVAYAILFWWWASAGYPTEAKICNPPASANDCESHNILFAFAVAALDKLNFYGVLITAIATGFIAWFTWTLRQSTEKMWIETKSTANSVTVVERAYVYPVVVAPGAIEQCIQSALDSEDDDVPAPLTTELTFKFKNFGKTPAILREAFVGFGVAQVGALIGVSIPESVLASLEETDPLTSQMQVGITRRQAQNILVYTAHICFEGHVTFDDIWGNEHMTEFYFVWDKEIRRMALRGVRTKTKQKSESPPS